MIYRLPTAEDEAQLREYVAEHHAAGEMSISASFGLSSLPYGEWLGKMLDNAGKGSPEWGRALLFLCCEGERIVGLLSVRYELSRELSEKYGDIGYGVRPTERRKGYARKMLAHALEVCREKGMKSVILGCYRDNIASAATIKGGGGVLYAENDNYKKGRISQYYTVSL